MCFFNLTLKHVNINTSIKLKMSTIWDLNHFMKNDFESSESLLLLQGCNSSTVHVNSYRAVSNDFLLPLAYSVILKTHIPFQKLTDRSHLKMMDDAN